MKKSSFLVLVFSTLALSSCSRKSGGDAAQSNTFFVALDSDPTTLNPITATDAVSREVYSRVYDNLLERDQNTWEWVPRLAEKWEVSKDGKTFTFTLREGVSFHDGKPMSAEDVKYSFDVYFEGRFEAPVQKIYYENIKEAKVLDPRTVQFTTKNVYFLNFDVLAELTVIPKHFYGVGDPKDRKFNRELVGTGPYMLKEWERGQRVVLEKNPNYWGLKVEAMKPFHKFDRIFMRITPTEAVTMEQLKKGDIDYLGLSPEQYETQTKGDEWGEGKKLTAVKTTNDMPQNFSYGYIGWNFRNPLFQDRRVRTAMSHLINRDFMNEKFLYGHAEKATGPFGNRNPASSPKVKAIEYDPAKASALLKEAGWTAGSSGLVRGGKAFKFTILTASSDSEKYLTVIKEDMKKVGVDMDIKIVEWNSFMKTVDEGNYDAVAMAWQVNALEDDPKQIWHSSSAIKGGSNHIYYKNPELDKLIDTLRVTLDRPKRLELYHKMHEIIAFDQPYSFWFNRRFIRYGVNNRIERPQDTLKYAVGTNTWSLRGAQAHSN